MRSYVEGWTGPIKYRLLIDGQPFNATGMTVALDLRDRNGAVIAEVGPTIFSDPSQSEVQYTPNATDLTFAASPINVRFHVTSGPVNEWFPQGSSGGVSPEEWIIGLP